MKYADWIAVYAAVVATAVAFWNVYIYFRQGVRIEVQALPDFQMFGPSMNFSGDISAGGKEKVIIVEAVNVGGRKTTLTHLVVYVHESRWNRLLRKSRWHTSQSQTLAPQRNCLTNLDRANVGPD